jgi:hypothetical protein
MATPRMKTVTTAIISISARTMRRVKRLEKERIEFLFCCKDKKKKKESKRVGYFLQN